MSAEKVVRVRDVMMNNYAIVEGLITVAEAIEIAKQRQVKALIVNKRNDDDEYGIVLMNDIAKKKYWRLIARRSERMCTRS